MSKLFGTSNHPKMAGGVNLAIMEDTTSRINKIERQYIFSTNYPG